MAKRSGMPRSLRFRKLELPGTLNDSPALVFSHIIATRELHTAGASNTFHDFRCAGIEYQFGRQDHANRFFSAIGEDHSVRNTLAVEIDIGLLEDGYIVELA